MYIKDRSDKAKALQVLNLQREIDGKFWNIIIMVLEHGSSSITNPNIEVLRYAWLHKGDGRK